MIDMNKQTLKCLAIGLMASIVTSFASCGDDDDVIDFTTNDEEKENPVTIHTGKIVGELHVDGRYLKDAEGNVVNLHGMAQTYSP